MSMRAKITPVFRENGFVELLIEWCIVNPDETLGEVRSTERFQMTPNRAGCSYISRVGITEATELPGTFWLDESGKRHFIMLGEPLEVGAEVKAAALLVG